MVRLSRAVLRSVYLGIILLEHADAFRSSGRSKRAATQFYALIQCNQPDAMVLSLYGDYGCFCGPGGSGSTALDATDRCCQIHDRCYKQREQFSERTWTEYFLMKSPCAHLCVSYKHSCENGTATCDSDNTVLAKGLCECDKAAAKCFAEARPTYDQRLANVDPLTSCSDTSNVTDLLKQLYETQTPTSPTFGITSDARQQTKAEAAAEEVFENITTPQITTSTDAEEKYPFMLPPNIANITELIDRLSDIEDRFYPTTTSGGFRNAASKVVIVSVGFYLALLSS